MADRVITIQTDVDESRQLTLTLPPDTPPGPVEVTIRPRPGVASKRATIRDRLLAAGLLATGPYAPSGAIELAEAERDRLGRLLAGQSSVDVLIDAER
ncbi:MAG: hypothetical protein JW910_17090 [Anaerolineae bacterium]|nr:hypothetical protein [Anaerolineae bacterium]